jgi:hypothetical protein
MRAIIIKSFVVLIAVAIAWVFGARPLALIVDRFYTAPLSSLPVSPLAYSLDTLWIGDLSFSLSPDVRPIEVRVGCGSANRVILSSGGRLFALGTCTRRMPARTGEFQFVPDPGDDVSLVVSRSVISWPTPFELNFMTGAAPSWKRDLYYQLRWKKPSGAQLAMVWRFEQGFSHDDGWTAGTMTREGSTGLLHLELQSTSSTHPIDGPP